MSAKCKPGQVINPRTGRPINVNGPTFKKLPVDVQSQLLKAAMPDVPTKTVKKPSPSKSKSPVKYTPQQIAKTYCNDSIISYEITINFLPEQSDLKQIRGLATNLKMNVRRNTKLQTTTIKFKEKTQNKVKKNRLDKMELKLKELGYKPNMIKMTDGSLFNPEFKKYVKPDSKPKTTNLTPKQGVIVNYLKGRKDNQASLDEFLQDCPSLQTFHNSKQYLGETLSRMIKSGIVQRVGRGVYSLPQKKYMVMLTTDGTMEDHDKACNFIRTHQLDLGLNSNGGGGRYFTNGHEFTIEQIKKNKFLSGKNKSFKIGKSKCRVSVSPVN